MACTPRSFEAIQLKSGAVVHSVLGIGGSKAKIVVFGNAIQERSLESINCMAVLCWILL